MVGAIHPVVVDEPILTQYSLLRLAWVREVYGAFSASPTDICIEVAGGDRKRLPLGDLLGIHPKALNFFEWFVPCLRDKPIRKDRLAKRHQREEAEGHRLAYLMKRERE